MIQEMNTASLFATNLWQGFTGVIGVPAVRWIGHDSGKLVLVSDPLGPTLEELHSSHCRHKLPPIDLLAIQLISRIQMMHKYSLAHGSLQPSSFCLGHYGWQSSQILLCDFHFTPSKAFVDDLRQVGAILAYLYGNAKNWSEFVALPVPERFKTAPTQVQKYMDCVNTPSPINYASLRGLFSPKQGVSLSTSTICADRSCLYDKLYSCLQRVGHTVKYPIAIWGDSSGMALLESQSEMLSIYLVLLARESKPRSCRAHDLKHRFWRDIQWLLKLAEYGPETFKTEIVGRVYKFLTVVVEIVPNNRQFWLEKLLYLAEQQIPIAASSKGWQKAAIHWRDELVHLRGKNALFRDADLVEFSFSQL